MLLLSDDLSPDIVLVTYALSNMLFYGCIESYKLENTIFYKLSNIDFRTMLKCFISYINCTQCMLYHGWML